MSAAGETVDAEVLWRELHERLLGFIARRVRTPEDAEDILQEVMLRIHQHHRDLEHADRVTGWVYRIAANAIADHYRGIKRVASCHPDMPATCRRSRTAPQGSLRGRSPQRPSSAAS